MLPSYIPLQKILDPFNSVRDIHGNKGHGNEKSQVGYELGWRDRQIAHPDSSMHRGRTLRPISQTGQEKTKVWVPSSPGKEFKGDSLT